MRLIERAQVKPYYAQVELGDPEASDYPQFETGTERAVANDRYIVVATRGDHEGPVTIEVWEGGLGAEDPRVGSSIYAGNLVLAEDRAVMGNTVGNDLHQLNIAAGTYRVEVFTSPADGGAERVYFVFDAGDAGG